jgi:hypothetical protein
MDIGPVTGTHADPRRRDPEQRVQQFQVMIGVTFAVSRSKELRCPAVRPVHLPVSPFLRE